jgi:hypothetical protein
MTDERAVVGKTYNCTTITVNFEDIGYVIKEAGNQGAHPDDDPDLLGFTSQDTEDLQQIFMELVCELFIVPVAKQKAKEEFLARRDAQGETRRDRRSNHRPNIGDLKVVRGSRGCSAPARVHHGCPPEVSPRLKGNVYCRLDIMPPIMKAGNERLRTTVPGT